jgi:signal transduction histidine kinase
MNPLRSLRVRLIVVFVTVVATAMGVLFLYVVPSLRADLISDRLNHLQSTAKTQQKQPQRVLTVARVCTANTAGELPTGRQMQVLRSMSAATSAQLSVYCATGPKLAYIGELDEPPASITSHSPLLRHAQISPTPVSDRSAGGRILVAYRVSTPTLRPPAVVLLSERITDVNEAASLVERQFLIATLLALGVAGLVGWAAAVAISRRLARLEAAASRVASGQFDQPIGDEAPDELGRLARSFDLMQSRLAQVDRARKDFIANASHELRTPLFSLAGFLELLESDDIDPATRDEFLDTMRAQVTRLTKLATDLLDLSRLDSGAVSIEQEPLDLASTARTLVREFRGLASRHGSRVVLARESVPAEGIGDEQRVQQIGRVLVDNAIRHNPRGTNVRVVTAADNGYVTLTVSDDGPGIPDEARPHLFDRFYRGAGTTATGTGLGLAIARELAQRMDGTLSVDSAEGHTEFVLSLPSGSEPSLR